MDIINTILSLADKASKLADKASKLVPDSEELERDLLKQLSPHKELSEWSKALQLHLDALQRANKFTRPLVCKVFKKMPLNAFALPHRTIVVSLKLAEHCKSDRDQLAFVLAHEAAHIQLGHASEKSSLEEITKLALLANPPAGAIVSLLLDRAFSKEQEFEADAHAIKYCRNSYYLPERACDFLESLKSYSAESELLELLNTHPPLEHRTKRLRQLLAN